MIKNLRKSWTKMIQGKTMEISSSWFSIKNDLRKGNKICFRDFGSKTSAFHLFFDLNPLFFLITNIVMKRKKQIQPSEEKKPLYTVGCEIVHALADNALKVSVDSVIGRIHPTDLRIQCIPSSGHIIPSKINKYALNNMKIWDNKSYKISVYLPLIIARGKKLPRPINVAAVSVSHITETMNPANKKKSINHNDISFDDIWHVTLGKWFQVIFNFFKTRKSQQLNSKFTLGSLP